jgi:hypothetical protein
VGANRAIYVLKTSPENVETVWDAVLEVVLPRALTAEIDGYPDPSGEQYSSLSHRVRNTFEQLVAVAAERPDHARDSKMNIHLNLKNDHHVDIVRVYGPHSISVELFDEWQRSVANLSDEGSGGTATLSLDETEQLQEALQRRSLSDSVLSGPFKSGRRGRLEPA